MNRQIDNYISNHSSPEQPFLEELYRQTHLRFVNPNMVSGHTEGLFLQFIAKMIQAHDILEIGTYTGYSAICLAMGLKEGGKLVTIEANDEHMEFCRSYFKKAGVDNDIILINGKAQDVVPELDTEFDLAYIDGDKREYCDYFNIVMPKMKKGGFIVADNVLWGGKVLDNNTKDPQTLGVIAFNEMIRNKSDIVENVILPVRDGIMLIRKK